MMEHQMKTRSDLWFIAAPFLGSIAGFVLITAPYLVQYVYPGSFPKLVYGSLEHTTFASLLLLFGGGLFFGLIFEIPCAFIASVSQVASLPAAAIVEMVKDPTSHNLWPIEFVQYVFLAISPLAGMGLAWWIKRHFQSTLDLADEQRR
jgi:hypothetical protein